MKKRVFSLGMMFFAALTFTNCAKQEVIAEVSEQPAGVPFELTAGMDTKTTTTDGADISWAEGDQLNVFYREHGATGDYQGVAENGAFTFTSGTSFTGALANALDAEKRYDWWVLYPYNKYIETPANTSSGYLPIGTSGVNKSTGVAKALTQQGNSNKAHLAGEYFPLYGKVENVAADEKPSVTMNQAMSILKIHVTNASADALTVATVSVTAPEDIVGTYYIDFSGATPAFKKSGNDYVSETANLTVSGGAPIAQNGMADFYVAIKPFTQAATGVLTVSVNGYEREITLPAGTEFKPGKIMTVNFSYDKVENYLADGDYVIMAKEADKYYAVSVEPNGTSKRRDYVEVAYAGGSTFNTDNSKIIWNFARTGSTYKISNGTDYMTVASNSIPLAAEGDDLTVSENEGIYTITSGDRYLAKNSTYGFGFYASGTGKHDLYIVPASLVVVPIINVTSEKTMEVSNINDYYAIEYTIENPVGGKSISAVADVTWIKDFDYSTDGEVSFEVEAQAAAASARSGIITLSYDGAADVEVTVNQAAGAGAEKSSYTITWNATNNSKGISSYTDSWTVTADGLTCNMNNFNNNNNGWNLVKCGSKKAASVATIITASAIPEAIKTVTITIDAITAASINSIKLYVSDSSSFGSTEAGTFTAAKGDQSVVIASPANNKYYKIEVDCKQGSSNGLLTLSKLVFAK